MKRIYLVLALFLGGTLQTLAQIDGDFRSRKDGIWTTPDTWQIRNSGTWATATSFPNGSTNVYIQRGHTVTLTEEAFVQDLNLETSDAVRLALGEQVLNVFGKLRAFNAGATTNTTDGNLPGVSTSNLNSSPNWITSTTGKILITGGTRTLTEAGEWGAGNAGTSSPNGFDIEIQLYQTPEVLTLNTSFKARSFTILEGTLDMKSHRLSPDMGVPGLGNVVIDIPGVLASSASGWGADAVMGRSASSRGGSFILYGLLRLSGVIPTIAMNTVNMEQGRVEYSRAGGQILLTATNSGANPDTYNDIIFSNSGIKILSQNISVSGTLSMRGTACLSLGFSSLEYGPAATLDYGGSTSQTTSSSEFPAVNGPHNLKITNGNGDGVTLHAPRTIDGQLILMSGVLNTTSTNLLTINEGGSTLGASNNSFVCGPIAKKGTSAFTFPVGGVDGGNAYHPISMSAPGSSVTFIGEYVRASGAGLGPVSPLSGVLQVSNCEYWKLAPTTPSTVNVTLTWDNNSGCGDVYINSLSALRIVHFNGTIWDAAGGTADPGSTTDEGSITWNDVSNFSPFTLGTSAAESPLPMKFGSISAYEKQTGIQVDWTSYSESNLSHYLIERSSDGIAFISVGRVTAQNITGKRKYSWFDPAPLASKNFYRIISVDFDAKKGYSSIVLVSLDKSVKDIVLYPNPLRGEHIAVQSSDLLKGNYTAKIFSTLGQQVYIHPFKHAGGAINQTLELNARLKAGVYVFQLENGIQKVMSRTIIVQ
jgi:hypothetical protein